jgi:two-component system sensor histidine kinase/response regulator
MVDHVAKPIDPAALYDVLARFRPVGRDVPRNAVRAAVADSAPPSLPAVDGLDTAQGLRRVSGKQALYVSLLRQFLDGQADAAERIRESLDRGERAVAERLAHTVRGVAGNLAAGPVQAAAGALEKAIRDGAAPGRVEASRTKLADALASLSAALRPLLDAFVPAPEAASRPAAAPAADASALRALSERWAKLLADCDAGTIDGLEREGDLLHALFGGADAFAGFAKQVKAYDFDGALDALRRAASAKGLEG